MLWARSRTEIGKFFFNSLRHKFRFDLRNFSKYPSRAWIISQFYFYRKVKAPFFKFEIKEIGVKGKWNMEKQRKNHLRFVRPELYHDPTGNKPDSTPCAAAGPPALPGLEVPGSPA